MAPTRLRPTIADTASEAEWLVCQAPTRNAGNSMNSPCAKLKVLCAEGQDDAERDEGVGAAEARTADSETRNCPMLRVTPSSRTASVVGPIEHPDPRRRHAHYRAAEPFGVEYFRRRSCHEYFTCLHCGDMGSGGPDQVHMVLDHARWPPAARPECAEHPLQGAALVMVET